MYLYFIPLIINIICYTFLIYKDKCYGHVLGWALCVMPMINLAWAVIMVAGCLEYFWNQRDDQREIA